MKQRYYLLMGFIVVLGLIYISGCVEQPGGEYIPPELRASAINIDENQARQQAEIELINGLGQDYFISHYTYLRTEPIIQNQERVGYKIYYSYDYNIENFESKEMYIYIGAVGPEHKIIFNKEGILNYPIQITYSDTEIAKTDCLSAFSNETKRITTWSHNYIIHNKTIILRSVGEIENSDNVISCEFDVTNGDILIHDYGTKVTSVGLK